MSKFLKLNNGMHIPMIGTGASPTQGVKSKGWILTAINAGFRHIDTADIYGTEEDVAAAIHESGIPREEFFITTKLNWTKHDHVPRAIEESLARIRTNYVDLYLIHLPQVAQPGNGDLPQYEDGTYKLTDEYTFASSWQHLEAAYRAGKCKAIGVSNFSIKTLEELLPTVEILPAVNQVELHPYLTQIELLAYCQIKGIAVVAFSPGGKAIVRQDPTITSIASRYPGATPTQIIIAWHLARGVVCIPKSTNADRQKENLKFVTLSSEDVDSITQLDRNERIAVLKGRPEGVHDLWYGWMYEQLGWKSDLLRN